MYPGTVLPALPHIHLALRLRGKLSWGHTCPYFLEVPLTGPHVGEVEKSTSLPQDSLTMCSPSSICQPHTPPRHIWRSGEGTWEWTGVSGACLEGSALPLLGHPIPTP